MKCGRHSCVQTRRGDREGALVLPFNDAQRLPAIQSWGVRCVSDDDVDLMHNACMKRSLVVGQDAVHHRPLMLLRHSPHR